MLWTTAMARSGRMYLTLLAWANPVPALFYFSRSPLTTAGLPSNGANRLALSSFAGNFIGPSKLLLSCVLDHFSNILRLNFRSRHPQAPKCQWSISTHGELDGGGP